MITRVIDALERGSFVEAYREVIAVWRGDPSDELAALASEILELIRPRPQIRGRSWKESWREIAAAKDPVDIPRLVEVLEHSSLDEVVMYLPVLAEASPDPTLAYELARVLKDLRWYSLRAIEAYRRVCDIVARGGGAREVRYVELALAHAGHRDASFRAELIERLHATLATLRARPPATSDLAELRRTIDEAAARRAARAARTTALFAEVYAALTDDGPRLALADHLIEDDDPRGELIALQCGGRLAQPQRRRIRELLAAYGVAWLAEAGLAVDDGPRYERGFPTEITVRLDGSTRGNPVWSTIRSVVLRRQEGIVAKELFDPVCRSLRTVHGMNLATMTYARACTHPTTIAELGFRNYEHGFDHLPAVLRILPTLRHIHIAERFELASIAAVLARQPLDRITLDGMVAAEHLRLLGPQLAELASTNRGYTLRFHRDAPRTGHLAFADHGWEELRRLELAITPDRLVIDRLDPRDCEDCLAAICSDAELAAQLGCPVEWR